MENLQGNDLNMEGSFFKHLRDKDYTVRLRAFDQYVNLADDESSLSGTISDFVEILSKEIIPELAESRDSIQLGALVYILDRLGEFSLELGKPTPLIKLIDRIFSITNHSNDRIASSAIRCLSKLFQSMPEELTTQYSEGLTFLLTSKVSSILSAAVDAWSRIANVSSDKAVIVEPKIFELLENDNPEVRIQAVGFFLNIGKRMKGECSYALPVLRQIRDNDHDVRIRARASAAIQAISRI